MKVIAYIKRLMLELNTLVKKGSSLFNQASENIEVPNTK